jgi:hypothetical protein
MLPSVRRTVSRLGCRRSGFTVRAQYAPARGTGRRCTQDWWPQRTAHTTRGSSIFLRRIVGASLTTSKPSRHTVSVQAAGAGSHKPRVGGGGRARSPRSHSVSTLSARSVSLHHDGVSAPNISSVTVDHDDSCELPPREGGGSPNQCCGHSRTSANTSIPAQTPRPTTAAPGHDGRIPRSRSDRAT